MTTAIDSNVIIGLLNSDDALNTRARTSLDAAYAAGGLVICGAVFAELHASPGRTEEFVNSFLDETEIVVDWSSSETIWRSAGSAFQKYASRRRRLKTSEPRRILTDFYIGAHAFAHGHRLLTLDDRIFRTSFPELSITKV
ncbi:MAG TPA: type II toxin-antitoxin system VapC family toxin [Pyrinomonadaceae bacterium]|nr:type II toxin-antitoxin system VapC family toxin [Pyrinomonadaceae bacterium]